jgi:hypothetical protein
MGWLQAVAQETAEPKATSSSQSSSNDKCQGT